MVTIVLGLVFLTAQMFDTASSTSGRAIRVRDNVLHSDRLPRCHVAGGVIFMGVILARSMAGQFSAARHEAVEACSFYWHFVDVVWIALFTGLYIVK